MRLICLCHDSCLWFHLQPHPHVHRSLGFYHAHSCAFSTKDLRRQETRKYVLGKIHLNLNQVLFISVSHTYLLYCAL